MLEKWLTMFGRACAWLYGTETHVAFQWEYP